MKVIAYDRPIPDKPADFYVSFDNQGIGKAIAESLRRSISRPQGVPTDTGGMLQINGSPTDAAAGLIRDGVHEALAAGKYKTLAEFDTPDWFAAQRPGVDERARSPASATRSSASWRPTTAPAAAPSPPSRRRASIRCRR